MKTLRMVHQPYAIQERASLGSGTWTDLLTNLVLTNLSMPIPVPAAQGRPGFFRAYQE